MASTETGNQPIEASVHSAPVPSVNSSSTITTENPPRSSDIPRPELDEVADHDDDTTEVRAKFVNPLDKSKTSKPQTSPLLSATPPTVSKALVKAYPYLLIVNKLLSIATWTNDDCWINVVMICVYSLAVLYFESLVIWFGHIIIVGIITMYAYLNKRIVQETKMHPTLDEVIQALTATCIKADMLLNPITSLSLTAYDIKRLLFTTLFLTPLYLIITFLLIKPRIILLISGIYLLTYHSSQARVTRKIIWKIKLARLICFYLTGLDFSQARNHSLFAAAFAKVQKNAGFDPSKSSGNKPVRFTYVIYENQRRWLGIGWTSNLLSYERTPWTDEFLNESSALDSFQLPNASDDVNFNNPLESSSKMNGASWRWVDKTWRLDLTNDGAITLPNNKRSKTTANPSSDEGYIYYDNTWKKPLTEDSFSKYTRRRRWIRTAELVFNDPTDQEETSTISEPTTTTSLATVSPKTRKRKSLRFADPEPTDENQDEVVDMAVPTADSLEENVKKND